MSDLTIATSVSIPTDAYTRRFIPLPESLIRLKSVTVIATPPVHACYVLVIFGIINELSGSTYTSSKGLSLVDSVVRHNGNRSFDLGWSEGIDRPEDSKNLALILECFHRVGSDQSMVVIITYEARRS